MTRNHFTKLSKKESGRLGALARLKKYGNPGTVAGRKKGGLHSIETHKKLKTNFKTLKKINNPDHNIIFAEFIGIMLGDGYLGQYQVAITTNKKTDYEHAAYIQALFKKLFNIEARLSEKKNSNAYTIVASSRALCTLLESEGLQPGNKITNRVSIPQWILNDTKFRKACARGLFDTDGSVFYDAHKRKDRTYHYMGVAFANKNNNLLTFFAETLEEVGLSPTRTTPWKVFLRRREEIDIFFKIIGSSNPKHLKRYKKYKDGYLQGGVG